MDRQGNFIVKFALLKFAIHVSGELFFFYSLKYYAKFFYTSLDPNPAHMYLFFPKKFCSNEEMFQYVGNKTIHNAIYQQYDIKNSTACLPDNLVGKTVFDVGQGNIGMFSYGSILVYLIGLIIRFSATFKFLSSPGRFKRSWASLASDFSAMLCSPLYSFVAHEIAFIMIDNQAFHLSPYKNAYRIRWYFHNALLITSPLMIPAVIMILKRPLLLPLLPSFIALCYGDIESIDKLQQKAVVVLFFPLFMFMYPLYYIFQYLKNISILTNFLLSLENLFYLSPKSFFETLFLLSPLASSLLPIFISLPLLQALASSISWKEYASFVINDFYALFYYRNPFSDFPISFFDGSAFKTISMSLNIIFLLKKYADIDIFESAQSFCAKLAHRIQDGYAFITSSIRYYECRYHTQRITSFFSHREAGGKFELIETNTHDKENENLSFNPRSCIQI